jgi:hypothetical protein
MLKENPPIDFPQDTATYIKRAKTANARSIQITQLYSAYITLLDDRQETRQRAIKEFRPRENPLATSNRIQKIHCHRVGTDLEDTAHCKRQSHAQMWVLDLLNKRLLTSELAPHHSYSRIVTLRQIRFGGSFGNNSQSSLIYTSKATYSTLPPPNSRSRRIHTTSLRATPHELGISRRKVISWQRGGKKVRDA